MFQHFHLQLLIVTDILKERFVGGKRTSLKTFFKGRKEARTDRNCSLACLRWTTSQLSVNSVSKLSPPEVWMEGDPPALHPQHCCLIPAQQGGCRPVDRNQYTHQYKTQTDTVHNMRREMVEKSFDTIYHSLQTFFLIKS